MNHKLSKKKLKMSFLLLKVLTKESDYEKVTIIYWSNTDKF